MRVFLVIGLACLMCNGCVWLKSEPSDPHPEWPVIVAPEGKATNANQKVDAKKVEVNNTK